MSERLATVLYVVILFAVGISIGQTINSLAGTNFFALITVPAMLFIGAKNRQDVMALLRHWNIVKKVG